MVIAGCTIFSANEQATKMRKQNLKNSVVIILISIFSPFLSGRTYAQSFEKSIDDSTLINPYVSIEGYAITRSFDSLSLLGYL